MQECARMNRLISEVRSTLDNLAKGLSGALNMSEAMEDLVQALSINQVPGRNPFHKTSWERYAWWSKKSLTSWFSDLLRRIDQLQTWQSTFELPKCLWYSGLFNPMAFNTAVMQVTARNTGQALDNMTTETHITTNTKPEGVTDYPVDGACISGIFIEGARWHFDKEEDEPTDMDGTPVGGCLAESYMKELLPIL